MATLKTVLVGSKWVPGGVEAARLLRKGDQLILRREPENEKDPNAVACFQGDRRLGFIPRKCNSGVAVALDAGTAVSCEVTLEGIVQDFKGGADVLEAPHLILKWEAAE